MSEQGKNDSARGWLYIQKLIEEADDERVAKLSDDELRAELETAGAMPAGEWDPDELVDMAAARAAQQEAAPEGSVAKEANETTASVVTAAPAPAPAAPKFAPVVPIRRRWVPLALAAAAGFVLVMFIKMAIPPPPVASVPSDRDIAEGHRNAAEEVCAAKMWARCKAGLDEAAKLDPKGESEPRVQKMRGEVAAGMAGDDGSAPKPGP